MSKEFFITPHLLRDQATILRRRAAVVLNDAGPEMSQACRFIIEDAAADMLRQAQDKERQADDLEAALKADETAQRYG